MLDELIEESGFEPEDRTPNVEQAIISGEETAASKEFVRKLIEKLPVRQRRIFSLVNSLDGFDKATVVRTAEMLSVDRKTIQRDLAAASATLRKELIALGYGPGPEVLEILSEAA